VVVEKTVSNSLRLEFVDMVFPQAKYIHLIRNGIDVIESAHRQWLAPPDFRYILRKGLSFPILDAFGYGVSYARKTVSRFFGSNDNAPPVWGPHYRGIEEDLENKELLEVCAIQWSKCVEKATNSFLDMGDSKVCWIRYEDFVQEPEAYMRSIAAFIGVDPKGYDFENIQTVVDTGNVGKGHSNLTEEQINLIKPYIDRVDTMLTAEQVASRFQVVKT
jgi:hypothetical protein